MSSLVELIGATVVLKRHGSEYYGLCPFHNEKTPSFNVIPDKGFYYCHGCGARGDAAGWIMQTQNVRYPEAKRILGEPVKPDPAILAARAYAKWCELQVNLCRDRNIDCACGTCMADPGPMPNGWKPSRAPHPRVYTQKERIATLSEPASG